MKTKPLTSIEVKILIFEIHEINLYNLNKMYGNSFQ